MTIRIFDILNVTGQKRREFRHQLIYDIMERSHLRPTPSASHLASSILGILVSGYPNTEAMPIAAPMPLHSHATGPVTPGARAPHPPCQSISYCRPSPPDPRPCPPSPAGPRAGPAASPARAGRRPAQSRLAGLKHSRPGLSLLGKTSE